MFRTEVRSSPATLSVISSSFVLEAYCCETLGSVTSHCSSAVIRRTNDGQDPIFLFLVAERLGASDDAWLPVSLNTCVVSVALLKPLESMVLKSFRGSVRVHGAEVICVGLSD